MPGGRERNVSQSCPTSRSIPPPHTPRLTDTDGLGIQLERRSALEIDRLASFREDGLVIDRDVALDVRLELERDVPQRLVFLGLDVSRVQEPVLGDLDRLATVDLFHADHGEPDVQDPLVHDPRHVHARSLGNAGPEILGRGVPIQVFLQVDRDSLQELVLPDHGGEHSQDRRSLGVRDRIKDLVDLIGIRARHLDGVRRSDGIEGQGGHQVGRQEFPSDLELGEDPIGDDDLSLQRRERLVQPENVPPFRPVTRRTHQTSQTSQPRLSSGPGIDTPADEKKADADSRNDIPKPHVRTLMTLHIDDPLLSGQRALLLVVQIRRRPPRDQPPVLHRAGIEIMSDEGIQLGQRVRDVEYLFVNGESETFDVECELSLTDQVRGGVDLEGDGLARQGGSVFGGQRGERSVCESDEVGRDERGLFKLGDRPFSLAFELGQVPAQFDPFEIHRPGPIAFRDDRHVP